MINTLDNIEMNALKNPIFRRPYIALMFGDNSIKHWSDEALEILCKEAAKMMLHNDWKSYYKKLKKVGRLGKPEFDAGGIWYETPIEVALRVDFRKDFHGLLYVDG